MKEDHEQGTAKRSGPRRVRLPGFVGDEPVGLGDAVKRVTDAVGIRGCGPCARRAQVLNSWVVFTAGRG